MNDSKPEPCNGERTRLACSFRRLAENIVPTIQTNVLLRQNGETKFATNTPEKRLPNFYRLAPAKALPRKSVHLPKRSSANRLRR
jgi:hypothetical protein